MPTTNLPSESVSSVSSDTIILLKTRTSNNGTTLLAGAEHFINSASRLNLLSLYNILQFVASGNITVINNMIEGVDYNFKTTTTDSDLVEGVDYEIEYNDAVNIPFWIETGSPFRNQERGEMSGYNAVKRRNAYSDFAITTEPYGIKVFLPRVVPIPVSINTNPVVHTRVRSGSTTINMSLPSISHMGKSVIQKGYAQIGISMLVTASGTNATKSSSVSLSMSLSLTAIPYIPQFETTDIGRLWEKITYTSSPGGLPYGKTLQLIDQITSGNQAHALSPISANIIDYSNLGTDWKFYDSSDTQVRANVGGGDEGIGLFGISGRSYNHIHNFMWEYSASFPYFNTAIPWGYKLHIFKEGDYANRDEIVLEYKGTTVVRQDVDIRLDTGLIYHPQYGMNQRTTLTFNNTYSNGDHVFAYVSSVTSPDNGVTQIDQDDGSPVVRWTINVHP